VSKTVKVRLLFVDDGEYHHETVEIPAGSIDAHQRIIDCLREDDAVQKKIFVDVDRLVAAQLDD